MRNSSKRGTTRTQKSTTTNSASSRNRKSTTTTNNSGSSYASVAKNIYRDGTSYRARVSVNGIRESRNFRTKREAIEWRNSMVAERA